MFGHSWKERGGRWWLNPGSARFGLPRSMALLRLPPKGSGQPQVEQLALAPKAPPRVEHSNNTGGKQQGRA